MTHQKPSQKKPLKNALVLTGVAFQMGATIYLFVMLGKWLDNTYNNGARAYVIVATLMGVGISLYLTLKQLNRINS
ncbi:AtpZ/AtpI family protein [Flavobacteriaceae bacterium]|nr:AtpZ/AtpI family protein [Flavobacteriaceae bacterium]